MKKIFIYIISAVLSLSISFSVIPTASADMNPQTYQFISEFLLQLASIYLSSSTTQSQKTEALNTFNQIWRASYSGTRVVRLSVDELYDLSSNLSQAGWQNHIVSVTNISDPNFSNSSVCWVIRGDGANVTEWIDDGVHVESIPSVFVFSGDYLCNQNGYLFYADPSESPSYFWDGISSFVQSISSKLSTTNQKLDNLYSAITGQSPVVAEARSIIEQLSVYTSSSDTTNSAKQYWSRTFVDPSSNFSMVYVTYEDLSQLVLDLANIGVTTRIYYDEVKHVYVIRDVGAWIVDPNTRSDYYSSTAASDSSYHFYQYYFSLGRGQVICSSFPSLSLLLNDLNLRIVTVWNSIETANSRLLTISNRLGTISSHLISLEDLLQAIVDYLESHGELDYQPPFYVRNISDSNQSYRIVPYDSMCQMLSDINVNYLGYSITDIAVGEPVSLISSASMAASYSIAENDYYSLIIRYRNESGEDIVGCLCDENGNAFRAYQMDNYPFRILNKLNDIYNWLDSADLITSDDIDEMVEKSNSKVYKFLKFTNRYLGVFNDVFDFDLSLSDWSSIHEYLSQTGRD